MPALGWKSLHPAAPDSQVYIMSSRFEVGSLPDSFRFLLNSLLAWKQVQRTPGAHGAALLAHPFQRVFYTLSAWEDRDALYNYAKTEPHKSVVRNMRELMRTSTFTFWTVPASELPISWTEAQRRISESAAAESGNALSPMSTAMNNAQNTETHCGFVNPKGLRAPS